MAGGMTTTGRGFTRAEVVLGAMAAGGAGTLFEPARLSILLFLIDREIPDTVEGPHFEFLPHRYGPFAPGVPDTLESLRRAGRVRLRQSSGSRTWALTDAGLGAGGAVLERLPVEIRGYVIELARWVRALRFSRLLEAIYHRYPHRYPEMRAEWPELGIGPAPPPVAARGRLRSFPGRTTATFDRTGGGGGDFLAPVRSRSDAEAIAEDWRLVGDDLRNALADFGASTVPPTGSPEEPPESER